VHHLQKFFATAAAAAATVSLVTAAPAAAHLRATSDEIGDVWMLNDDNSYSLVEAGRDNVDVVRSTVRHSDRRVTAAVHYDDLVRNTDTATSTVRLLTSGKRTYVIQLTAGPGNREGTVFFGRYTVNGLVDVDCSSIRKAVRYGKNRLVVSVGRACLKRPRWVRYSGEAVAVEEGPGTSYTDALMSGDPVNDLMSRRIRRG